jgi:spermidine synthase
MMKPSFIKAVAKRVLEGGGGGGLTLTELVVQPKLRGAM